MCGPKTGPKVEKFMCIFFEGVGMVDNLDVNPPSFTYSNVKNLSKTNGYGFQIADFKNIFSMKLI